MQAEKPFNPCVGASENEQISAKIWELLRHNQEFQAVVERLQKLDDQERRSCKETGKYHGKAWEKSCRLVKRAEERHPFAGVALEWLVPEPLLFVTRRTATAKGKVTREENCVLRPADLVEPKQWPWEKAHKPNVQGCRDARGPEIHFFTSNSRRFCDRTVFLSEWRGWKPEKPMFDCDTPWPVTPAGFRSKFQFIWRNRFDCRPTNPITGNRDDSPQPNETTFFQDWSLMRLVSRAQGEISKANDWLKQAPFPSMQTKFGKITSVPQAGLPLTDTEMNRSFLFDELASDFRVFAIPKTILTKGTAEAMGDWLADELKKGSDLYGKLLKGELLTAGDVLGSDSDWTAFLQHHSGKKMDTAPTGYSYRHNRYIKSLVNLIYPSFNVEQLLAPPTHRAHGKKYGRK